ncbi:MAG: response regulator transcription factor [Leptolyngbyaceae cyanobacterium]
MSTVLVVDDSRAQRQMMATALTEEHFVVHTAGSGLQALEQAQTCSPDIVVLDIVMPELNGYEVCRRLKRNPDTQNIPVIFCSSQSSQADIYWGLKHADAYITKPFRPQELTEAIAHLLNG